MSRSKRADAIRIARVGGIPVTPFREVEFFSPDRIISLELIGKIVAVQKLPFDDWSAVYRSQGAVGCRVNSGQEGRR